MSVPFARSLGLVFLTYRSLSGPILPTEHGLEAELGDDWRMWQWMNTHLPDDSVVVTFEPRTYYLQQQVIPGNSQLMADTFGTNTTVAVAAAKAAGAQYVLDTPWVRTVEVIRPPYERSLLVDALDDPGLCLLLHRKGQVRVFLLL